MSKPLYLQRLSKAQRLRFVNFRGTTPGNFTRLIVPGFGTGRDAIVDRSHPWARYYPVSYMKKLPYFHSSSLAVRALPKALLARPSVPHPDPPFKPAPQHVYGDDGKIAGQGKRMNVSLLHIISKKVHKSPIVRSKIKNRLKMALALLITRGVAVDEQSATDAKERLVVGKDADAGEKWALPDWTYLFQPTLEVYRMPSTTLVKLLREALSFVNEKALNLEAQWTISSALERKLPKPNGTTLCSITSDESSTSELKPPAPGRPAVPRKITELMSTGENLASMDKLKSKSRLSLTSSSSTLSGEYSSDGYISDDLLLDDDGTNAKSRAVPAWARPDFDATKYKSPAGSPFADNRELADLVEKDDKRSIAEQVMFRRKPILQPTLAADQPRRTRASRK